jgi:hypothetical protein
MLRYKPGPPTEKQGARRPVATIAGSRPPQQRGVMVRLRRPSRTAFLSGRTLLRYYLQSFRSLITDPPGGERSVAHISRRASRQMGWHPAEVMDGGPGLGTQATPSARPGGRTCGAGASFGCASWSSTLAAPCCWRRIHSASTIAVASSSAAVMACVQVPIRSASLHRHLGRGPLTR